MKFSDKVYKPYKEFERDGKYIYLYADEDLNECRLVVDEDENILSDEPTGECACSSCRESA